MSQSVNVSCKVPTDRDPLEVRVSVEFLPTFDGKGFGFTEAMLLARTVASEIFRELMPSTEQLRSTEAVVNSAIQSEAERLEMLCDNTNQAYSKICDRLALVYERIDQLEKRLPKKRKSAKPSPAAVANRSRRIKTHVSADVRRDQVRKKRGD